LAKARILLVDDQPLILLGLERLLRRMRNVWEVVVAGSVGQAQEFLEGGSFDALVTDLNMPGHGGVELLHWARERCPATARIVLSGHQDKSMIGAATATSHRFLNKPCLPEQLLDAIRQVLELMELPAGEWNLRAAVGAMGQLPASPLICHKLKTHLADPHADQGTLQELVGHDPGLATQALHIVNGAFFGTPGRQSDLREALLLLDGETLPSLIAEPAAPALEVRLRPLRLAHLQQARRAQAITCAEAAPPSVQNLAFTASLLSAAGPMILATAFPGVFEDARAALGVSAATISRHYLNLMGLPRPLLDLVACCQEPCGQERPSLAMAAVHVASGHLDLPFLARGGFQDRVPAWRQAMLAIVDEP
jgi:CheY-like chemotaxis protein